MKVFPDTKLYIISGCPCDPDYEHTLYFPNKEGQHAYFLTKAKYRVNEMSYQRAKRGRIRVQYKVEDLYDCNYIAFQNSSFGDKWFYAFIDDVTYVNNITSEISYTIDVIQTWITEMDLQQCFVVREHSVTDVAGDNLVPEDVQTGEMITSGVWSRLIPSLGGQRIIMAQALEGDGSPVEGGFYGRTYNQITYKEYACSESGIANLTSDIRALNILQNPNAVAAIFMCPDDFLITPSKTPSTAAVKNYTVAAPSVLKRSDGTNVKNNKLNTYPYTYLAMTNGLGIVNEYAYEYFEDKNNIKFPVTFSYTTKLSMTTYPIGYKTTGEARQFTESLSYDAFPECVWSTDNWGNRILNTVLSTGLGALTGFMSGGPVGAAVGAAMGGVQGLASGQVAQVNLPYEDFSPTIGAREDIGKRTEIGSEVMSRGMNAQAAAAQSLMATPIRPLNGNVHACNGNDLYNDFGWGFNYTQMRPLPQFIDRIDDYFSRYGYKTNRLKVPNISSRPQWNYVQTVGCKIGGSIPCQDEKLICSIFDHGVTFWKHPENVCNYSLDNSPT